MYDAIIVGARVAGASTALLLARKGMSVLVLDRASFPSDTLSTHQVQLPGIARLHQWGLLDRVARAGTPATPAVRFDTGNAVLSGSFPEHEGIDALYSPRRTLLDAMLIDAAREAGAEIRTDVVVDELCWNDGMVTGIRGRMKSGAAVGETASVVVGADGKHSFVARAAGAAQHRMTPPLTAACYTYWEGVPLTGGEMYARERRAIGAWPTNDGLAMTYVALPVREFETARHDTEGAILAALDLAGDLGERVRAGRRAERVRATPDLPNAFRRPYGPGWALVGDAGLVMDPVTGQGIADAFRDAELLSDALEQALSGRTALQAAMSRYERARNRAARPMFDFTTRLARLDPPRPAEQRLFAAIAEQPAQVQRFFGVLTGAVPQRQFFTPGNLVRLVGVRGTARLMLDKARASRRDLAVAAPSEPTPADGRVPDDQEASPWQTASTLLPSKSRMNTP
ncbi:MAG: NAD(P)/FAD-dependent oxidoreductase [Frankiaceae bacterium]